MAYGDPATLFRLRRRARNAGFACAPFPHLFPKLKRSHSEHFFLFGLAWYGSEASRAVELEKEASSLHQTVGRVHEELKGRTGLLAEASRRAMGAEEEVMVLRGRLRKATDEGVEKVKEAGIYLFGDGLGFVLSSCFLLLLGLLQVLLISLQLLLLLLLPSLLVLAVARVVVSSRGRARCSDSSSSGGCCQCCCPF